MNRKNIIQLLAFYAALCCLLLPAQAEDQVNVVSMFSLLLSEEGTIEVGGTCDDRGLPGPEIVGYGMLEWQRCYDGKVYDWEEAATYCHRLVNGGYSDWRLPTIDELKRLVMCSNGTPTPLNDYPTHPYSCSDSGLEPFDRPTIDPRFVCGFHGYWSSTRNDQNKAWTVSFVNGTSYDGDYIWLTKYVRCVR